MPKHEETECGRNVITDFVCGGDTDVPIALCGKCRHYKPLYFIPKPTEEKKR